MRSAAVVCDLLLSLGGRHRIRSRDLDDRIRPHALKANLKVLSFEAPGRAPHVLGDGAQRRERGRRRLRWERSALRRRRVGGHPSTSLPRGARRARSLIHIRRCSRRCVHGDGLFPSSAIRVIRPRASPISKHHSPPARQSHRAGSLGREQLACRHSTAQGQLRAAERSFQHLSPCNTSNFDDSRLAMARLATNLSFSCFIGSSNQA